MSQAGYIPQLFSLRLPNPEVIYELLAKSQARALIYDDSFVKDLSNCPIPIISTDGPFDSSAPMPVFPNVSLEDTAFLFHTSGSTSGSPKLIPYSYRWLGSAVHKTYQCTMPRNTGHRQVVSTWM
jgi:acyl-CoA synthetase (AMP-forming)/AMP-acid ligase II